MTIVLSGNSSLLVPDTAGNRVVQATPVLLEQNDDDTAGQTADEQSAESFFTLAAYRGQEFEPAAQAPLAQHILLSEGLPEADTTEDTFAANETLQPEPVSSVLSQLAAVTTLRFDFVASTNTNNEIEAAQLVTANLLLASQDSGLVAEPATSWLAAELAETLSPLTSAVSDSVADLVPLPAFAIEHTPLPLTEPVSELADTLPLLSAAAAAMTTATDVAAIDTTQVPGETVNNGRLASEALSVTGAILPLAQNQQTSIESVKPVTPVESALVQEAKRLGTAAATGIAVAEPTTQAQQFSGSKVPLPQHLSLTDNFSLQQFLSQQAVVSSVALTASNAPLTSAATFTAALPQWQTLSLSEAPVTWGPKLVAALGDKVVLQLGQQVQRAQIRLDPPQLGHIELRIAVEGEKTTVQVFAANAQVREAIQQTLDVLRLNLGQQLGASTQLDVQLGDQAQQQGAFFKDELAISQQPELTETEQHPESAQQQPRGWLNRLA